MLVLTRKQNEKIRIGDSIVITIVRMKGKSVRLGIEAPSDVNILRGELAFETTAKESLAKNENVAAAVDDHSQDQMLRSKTKSSVAVPHRNPGSNWSEEQCDEQSKTNPKAMMNPRLDRQSSELVSSFTI